MTRRHRAARGAALLVALATPCIAGGFEWRTASPDEVGMSGARLESLRARLEQQSTKALLVVRSDRIVLEWYAPGHGPEKPHYTASLAKALVGGLSLALALDDGRLALDDPASQYIPAWRSDPARSRITIRQLATHASGVEDAAVPGSSLPQDELPGWKGAFWRGRSIDPTPEIVAAGRDPFSVALGAPLAFEPGEDYAYSNPGMAALSYAVTASLRGGAHTDLRTLLRERILRPIGVADTTWSAGYGRTYPVNGLPLVANWGGGSFTARSVARVGRLVLRGGDWEGRLLLGAAAVAAMTSYGGTPLPPRPPGNPQPAPALGWYSNADGAWVDVPRDAIAGAGAGHQLLLVVPSLDLVVVRNGGLLDPAPGGDGFWGGLERHLFEPVVAAVSDRPAPRGPLDPPYPPSPVIRRLDWAPKRSIVRRARGSDNWPLTWADDDAQYTAYGDGWGFEPRVPEKLSMGFARITGEPPDFRGVNVRSPSGETLGDGASGRKASGILMVDGVLYLWARNAGNSRLAWSHDRGATWTWSDWRFETSFGAPTFLNFGRDYAGARDDFVYVYSFDSDSAYVAADRMVLARVHRDRVRDRRAYRFFAGIDAGGMPRWSADVGDRAAVFENPGACYRSGVTYSAALGRYLWVQVVPGAADTRTLESRAGPRFTGGLGVYDAPEPWGPWTTVYHTRTWDTGPGESASLPTRWMSGDGSTLHLVSSSEDAFSVRRVGVVRRRAAPGR